MNILVIGASQGTGAMAVRAALEKGHQVTAFSRNPQKLGVQHARLTYVPGDFHQQPSVDAAVKGHDAVIITASVSSLDQFKTNPAYFSAGTQLVINAMKDHGVRRLAVLSAAGTGDSYTTLPWLARKLLVGLVLKAAFEDHERQEKAVMDSGLEWVIARPGRLTDGPAGHRYQKATGQQRVPSVITRADVADFLVSACEEDTWLRKAVSLGG